MSFLHKLHYYKCFDIIGFVYNLTLFSPNNAFLYYLSIFITYAFFLYNYFILFSFSSSVSSVVSSKNDSN